MRFGNQLCQEHYDEIAVICEGSGWGDEEANVVCRSEMNTAYGLGGKAITHSLVCQYLLCILRARIGGARKGRGGGENLFFPLFPCEHPQYARKIRMARD